MVGFCVMSENCFFYLHPLPTCCVVNWYSGGKLPLNKHDCAYSWLDFVMSEDSFLLPPLPTCCVVNSYLGGKLPFNEHVCAYSCLDFV